MIEESQDLLMNLIPIALNYSMNILEAILIFVAGWVVAGWLSSRVYTIASNSSKIDKTLPPIMRKIVKVAIMIVTMLSVLGRFGVETASVIAVLGAATLAIGLALQGTLSNVASGVMLLIFRPFRVGDTITVSGISGSVVEIGIFTTTFKTGDGLAVIAPNARIWGNEITNFSKNDTRRLDLIASIGYSDDIDKAIAIISEMLKNDPRVLPDPAPIVVVNELADSSVNLLARPWCNRTDYWQLKWDMTKRIKELMDANNISIPFPQREIHLHKSGSGD